MPCCGATPISIAISLAVPGSAEQERIIEMFDAQSDRIYGLSNRVPTAVLLLEVSGAAVAVAALALHLAIIDRGIPTVLIVSLLVTILLVVTCDPVSP